MTARAGIPGAMAWGRQGENILMMAALLAMAVFPVLEIVLRALWSTGIPGSSGYVQHLTLWVGFLGAMVAAREGQHLSLSTGMVNLPPLVDRLTDIVAAAISTAVATGLTWASYRFVQAEFESPVRIGGWLPIWAVEAILPAAFAVIAVRFVARAATWADRAWVGLGIPAAACIGFLLEPFAGEMVLPALAGLVVAALFGAPIFVVLGGAALVLFFAEGVPVAAIPVEAYRIIVSPTIPTIPLFTLTGYLLAEGGASRRLVRLFRALFGWLPGGLAIAAAVVCAFFTTFTGASGVTILALGGLLLPVLLDNGYPRRFSLGLLTATGSIGLLFPPSLAIILFGVVAHVPIPALFKAGVVPGLLMVVAIAGFGIFTAIRARVPRPPFDAREVAAALWQAKWEVLLPAVVLFSMFGGFATLIEAAAISALYALVVEVVIHRDLRLTRDLPRILMKSATLIGSVFVILGVAMGITNGAVPDNAVRCYEGWYEEESIEHCEAGPSDGAFCGRHDSPLRGGACWCQPEDGGLLLSSFA